MIIDISHRLSFAAGGTRSVAHLLLSPLSGPGQTVKDWAIDMPAIETAARFTDAYGNRALLVTQQKPEGEIVVSIKGRVETHDANGVLGRIAGEPVVALYKRVTALTRPDLGLVEEFAGANRRGAGRIALYHAIMGRIAEVHRPAEPAGAQLQMQSSGAAADALEGAVADGPADAAALAHAFVATVRALDLPARYVTGYLAGDADHPAAFHAWAEAYDDGLGWIAFDPTLGLCPTDRHVRVAAGLDALATMPLRVVPAMGEIGGGAVEVTAQ
ncbi:MAG TPA: transglutaminase domain-containing protein [Devosia sp.]|nr:transglutaminase domain-containing protein [Devosia sp.]